MPLEESIHDLVRNNNIAAVQTYLNGGGDPDLAGEPGEQGMTLLHVAALNGHKEVVKLLVENDAQVSLPDTEGDTPLHFAAKEGYLEIVRFLVENGASVSLPNQEGKTPLHIAASKSCREPGYFE